MRAHGMAVGDPLQTRSWIGLTQPPPTITMHTMSATHSSRNMKLRIILLPILNYRLAISTCGWEFEGGFPLPFNALYEKKAPTEVAKKPKIPTTIPTISPVPSCLPPPPPVLVSVPVLVLAPGELFVVAGACVTLVLVRELKSSTERNGVDETWDEDWDCDADDEEVIGETEFKAQVSTPVLFL